MTQTSQPTQLVHQEVRQQAGKLLSQVAGYVGVRTIDIGLSSGLLEAVASYPLGITAEALAEETGLDPLYVEVWCRSAYAAEVLELGEHEAYTLAPHMDKLLMDKDFPGYIGGIPGVMVQPAFFDRFAENLPSGKRIWWDECSPTFIEKVSTTGQPFYTRLIPTGLSQVPGLSDREQYDLVLINISMHECRDIQKVTRNVYQALKPGGSFVISDFPFPASTRETRTVPARIMCGIQFFEALIGDQLLPTQAFVDLLTRHGFRDVGFFDLTPVHAVTYGRK